MNPAELLEGVDLGNGWKVLHAATKKPNATGGYFSHGYIAEHADGRRGFLKAMDYTRAFHSPDTASALAYMTNAYNFEKALCEKCAHLTRVARAIEIGSYNPSTNPFHKVEYMIFELADCDIRAHLDLQANLDIVFVLRALHHVATGLKQLHQADVAHQDLKPSNVLIYPDGEGSKICDLGRAWDRLSPAPHDGCDIAGDHKYAPIEAHYGQIASDERVRRFGCDMYHLGSLLFFCFTRTHTNAAIFINLAPEHRHNQWGGSYQEVLPYVLASFEISIDDFGQQVPSDMSTDLQQVVRELCNPDPTKRGHPKNSGRVQFSLERYVSRFDLMAHKAQLSLVRS